jgi:hypothetical protein
MMGEIRFFGKNYEYGIPETTIIGWGNARTKAAGRVTNAAFA